MRRRVGGRTKVLGMVRRDYLQCRSQTSDASLKKKKSMLSVPNHACSELEFVVAGSLWTPACFDAATDASGSALGAVGS